MRLDIAEIKRINTCGILKKNNWDYEKDTSSNPSYLLGMKEILRWHYKRGRPIDPESFMTFLLNLNIKMGLSHEQRIALEKAFREFVNSNYYLNMENVYLNYTTDIKINKLDVLEYNVPCFLNNTINPTFVYYDLSYEPKEIFLQRYEVIHNAVWSFYCLNKLPSFVRIWFDGEKIRHETLKVNEKYILKAKKILIGIGQNINIFVTPTIQTCLKCSMIAECDRFHEKKQSNKRGKNVTAN